ncbi:YibE/F family protein, partial [Corynebacterium sp.]|uniref:YibE/F family protein n=1 Tax=Corynebacterium sp. TaxID=1720 RepID=UPI002A90C97C
PEPGAGFRESQSIAAEAYAGEVTSVFESACGSPAAGTVFDGGAASRVPPGQECTSAEISISEGPDEGRTTLLQTSGRPGEPTYSEGDRIRLARQGEPASYFFLDMDRTAPLTLWLAVTAVAVMAAAAWRGVRALVGLAWTLFAVGIFLVPALLRGGAPIPLAVVAGSAILFPVMFLVHGVNWKSASALGGTLVSLAVSAGLAHVVIGSTNLRGLADDSNLLIQLYLPTVSITGLMLAGFIIGTLGALNDATVAQASTVAELAEANPGALPAQLFTSAMRVGRDHISSMVYTLVLAYVGAALPMTVLLAVVDRPLGQVLTSDVVATELLRSAVGAMGLALAVPATTIIAALTVGRARKA